MNRPRGFTLIELMISVTIMIIAIAAVTSLMVAAMSMNRNAQLNSDNQDQARIASGRS